MVKSFWNVPCLSFLCVVSYLLCCLNFLCLFLLVCLSSLSECWPLPVQKFLLWFREITRLVPAARAKRIGFEAENVQKRTRRSANLLARKSKVSRELLRKSPQQLDCYRKNAPQDEPVVKVRIILSGSFSSLIKSRESKRVYMSA